MLATPTTNSQSPVETVADIPPTSQIYNVRVPIDGIIEGHPQGIATQLDPYGFTPASEEMRLAWQGTMGQEGTGSVLTREGPDGGRLIEAADHPYNTRRVMTIATLHPMGIWSLVWCTPSSDVEQNAPLTLQDFDAHLRAILDGRVSVEEISPNNVVVFNIGPMWCGGKLK
jgi:hypothetical protein